MKKNLNAKFSNIVFYQDFPIEHETGRWTYHSLTGECVANKIYLSGIDNNTICVIDKNTGIMQMQYADNTRLLYEECLYVRSILYKSFIFFISNRLQSIIKFNINNYQKEFIRLTNADITLFEPIIYKHYLYLLPWDFSEQIICLNIENNTICYKHCPTNYKLFSNKIIQNGEIMFGNAVIIGNYIYRGSYQAPFVQKLHVESLSFEYINVRGFNRPIGWITYDGKNFWILSLVDGMLICWDEKYNKIIRQIDLIQETGKQDTLYTTCKYINGSIYILEKSGSCILELKLKENILLSFNCSELLGLKIRNKNNQAFSEEIRVDSEGTIYFFPFQANGIIAKKTDNSVYVYITETTKRLNEGNSQQIQNESICMLSKYCDLSLKKHKKPDKETHFGDKILDSIFEKNNTERMD